MQDSHAAAVVDVVVRNDDRVDARHVAVVQGQPPLDLKAAQPGIEQQPHPGRLDVDAIAVAAGLEGDDPHRGIVPRGGRRAEAGFRRPSPSGYNSGRQGGTVPDFVLRRFQATTARRQFLRRCPSPFRPPPSAFMP